MRRIRDPDGGERDYERGGKTSKTALPMSTMTCTAGWWTPPTRECVATHLLRDISFCDLPTCVHVFAYGTMIAKSDVSRAAGIGLPMKKEKYRQHKSLDCPDGLRPMINGRVVRDQPECSLKRSRVDGEGVQISRARVKEPVMAAVWRE